MVSAASHPRRVAHKAPEEPRQGEDPRRANHDEHDVLADLTRLDAEISQEEHLVNQELELPSSDEIR